MAVRTMLLTMSLAGAAAMQASTIGSLWDFNVFVFGDYSAQYTDVQGRTAVGHNFTATGVGLNSAQAPGADGVVVGNNAALTNGQLYRGDLRYGGTNKSNIGFLNGGTAVQGGIGSFFGDAQAEAEQQSALLKSQKKNGATVSQYGGLFLSDSSSTLNVFELDGGLLSSANYFEFQVPVMSTVLVNVLYAPGAALNIQNFGMTGASKQQVLFNFGGPSQLQLQNISFQGSILAPFSDVAFNNGNLEGTLVARNLAGNGQFHDFQFEGEVPTGEVPEPGTYALIGGGLVALAAAARRRVARSEH